MRKYLFPILLGFFVIFVGIYISSIFGLYLILPHVDKIYHFLGGFTLGWFFCLYLFSSPLELSKFKKIIIVTALVCIIGVFWEYAERLSSLYAPIYSPWVYRWFSGGDLNDTLLDILTDIIGGFVFSLIYILL